MFVPSTDNGRWIDENFARLAEVIKDYDPQLELRWIPPEMRENKEEKSKPYVVVDTRNEFPVLFANERDTPKEILGRLWNNDKKNGDILTRIDKNNEATEALKLKKKMEESEAKQDITAWVVGTTKNYINYNGKKFDHQFRPME